MKALLLVVVALLTVACGSAPVPAPEKKAATVRDDTALLLTDNRTSAAVVPDHLLGNKALPGGSLGEYEVTGKKYQLFIVETASAQDAAILAAGGVALVGTCATQDVTRTTSRHRTRTLFTLKFLQGTADS